MAFQKRTLKNSGRRIVVTGLGCVSPIGNDVASTWSAALAGTPGGANITQFDASKFEVRFACEVKNFDATPYVDKKELRRMDRFIQLGMAAALQAIDDAKLDGAGIDPDLIGTILSSGMGGLPMIEAQHRIGIERPDRMTPFFIPAVIPNMLAGQISIRKGYRGPNYAIVSACSSSAHAIGEGARMIERGDCEVVIAGGAESTVCLLGIAGFANMRALSTRNDDPARASRPFDKDRDGFVLGEGGAVLVLESLESAEKRGAKIYAEFAGYGANADAEHMTAPSVGGIGPAKCMRLAMNDAGMDISQIDHVNMHGTSTPLGDIAETLAVKEVFGARAKDIQCVSTKSMTGHLLGGAGAIEALLTSLALKHGKIPPTINIENQDPDCDLNYTSGKAVDRKITAALSNSFGFGGTNVSLLLKKF
jgi:3-oxoacyl-[acyl-carrier-protein] synthase II